MPPQAPGSSSAPRDDSSPTLGPLSLPLPLPLKFELLIELLFELLIELLIECLNIFLREECLNI
jgi:hypothetical protein